MIANRESDFGVLISFLLPGFISILGLSFHSEMIRTWIGQAGPDSPTVGGFLFLTVAAIFAGLTCSTIRWMVIDTLHHRSGIKPPEWSFERLHDRESGFNLLIQIHYRYYQFYGNSIVGVIWFWIAKSIAMGFFWMELLVAASLVLLFFAGSRDTLRKYYRRSNELLSASN